MARGLLHLDERPWELRLGSSRTGKVDLCVEAIGGFPGQNLSTDAGPMLSPLGHEKSPLGQDPTDSVRNALSPARPRQRPLLGCLKHVSAHFSEPSRLYGIAQITSSAMVTMT